jgi:hypothetical protein
LLKLLPLTPNSSDIRNVIDLPSRLRVRTRSTAGVSGSTFAAVQIEARASKTVSGISVAVTIFAGMILVALVHFAGGF